MARERLEHLPRGQTPSQALVQESSIAVVKAALSSAVPLAALVFDLGQAGIRFANQEQTDKLLESLAVEVDALSASRPNALQELAASPVYQAAVSEALSKLRHPRPPEFISRLANACIRLATQTYDAMTISRILRAFETIELEHYVLLDLHERYYSQRLTPEEVAKIGPVATGLEAIPHSSKLGPVARDAVGKTNYAYCIETLRQMGCFFDEEGPTWGPTEDDLAADKVTNFGRTVLGLYRD